MPPTPARSTAARRGLTLVEMLITVALLVLIMSVLVSIFTAATGSISTQRAYSALDQDLRRVEATIRRDLVGENGQGGITAKMDPRQPADPADNRGYFVYGENALADLQGEDTDDYIAFTARAPAGQPFTGTVVVPVANPGNLPALANKVNRITVTSDLAEIIYFLRNGNLYRRVFLILPKEWEERLARGIGRNLNNGRMYAAGGYNTASSTPTSNFLQGAGDSEVANLYGRPVSWIGLNDVSARPSRFSPLSVPPFNNLARATDSYMPQLNTLGDLTDRHNRAFNPRHADDFTGGPNGRPDGIPDDLNGDSIPDFYPTLYPAAFGTVIDATAPPIPAMRTFDLMAFPYVYPNGFSRTDPFTSGTSGALHSLDPSINPANVTLSGYPRVFNHSPLDLGDPLGPPAEPQTWWGFPTKKETLSPFWTDPIKRLNDPANALFYVPASPDQFFNPTLHAAERAPGAVFLQALPLRTATSDLPQSALPPMTATWRGLDGEQPFNDGAGALSAFKTMPDGSDFNTAVWTALPEDDLILSGVRSFDVKALETRYYVDPTGTLPAMPPATQYVDLGYGAADNDGDGVNDFAIGTPEFFTPMDGPAGYVLRSLTTFAHEGRIPPRVEDQRADARWPALRPNIGDNTPGVVRLRRVWDSWSTTYARTPDPLDPSLRPPLAPPALPSYPAPYPAPLAGIQIQIRVVDPANQRTKILTIRHEFSDRLN